jgi:plasmid stabilization system protein ParE
VSRRLPVDVSDLAREQIIAADRWWRANRPNAPNAIQEELERAALLISSQPGIGARAKNVRLPDVRRVHLARVHYHLYYRTIPRAARIQILAFWHTSRESNPEL